MNFTLMMTPDMFRELVIKYVESKDYKDPDEKFGSDWDFAKDVMQDFCLFIGMDIVIPDAPEITAEDLHEMDEQRRKILAEMLPYVETMFVKK